MHEGTVDIDVEFEGDSDILAAGQDFSKLTRAHTKAGFKEGATAGRDLGVQDGFAEGLHSGYCIGLHRGRVEGIIQAMLLSCEPGSPADKELRELLQELKKIVPDEDSIPPVSGLDSLVVSNVLDQPSHNQLSLIMHRLNQLKT